MIIYFIFNQNLKMDLDKAPSKNSLVRDKFIKPAYKVEKSITETNSKVQKLKTYNKKIYNSIYKNKQNETIDEEL